MNHHSDETDKNQGDIEAIKKSLGLFAASQIKDGTCLAIGGGSTVAYFIKALGVEVKKGLHIKVATASKESEALAIAAKIPLLDLESAPKFDLMVDGADEINAHKQMLKGGGAALLREKLLAKHSKKVMILVDHSKLSQNLGHFPLVLEVTPFATPWLLNDLKTFGSATLRAQNNEPLISDNGNHIIDLDLHEPEKLEEHNKTLSQLPGVIETGLFLHFEPEVYVGINPNKIELLEKLSF